MRDQDIMKLTNALLFKVHEVIDELEAAYLFAESAMNYYLERAKTTGEKTMYDAARRFDGIRHDIDKAKNKMVHHVEVYKQFAEVKNE